MTKFTTECTFFTCYANPTYFFTLIRKSNVFFTYSRKSSKMCVTKTPMWDPPIPSSSHTDHRANFYSFYVGSISTLAATLFDLPHSLELILTHSRIDYFVLNSDSRHALSRTSGSESTIFVILPGVGVWICVYFVGHF